MRFASCFGVRQAVSATPDPLANYLFLDNGEVGAFHSLLSRSDVAGAQRVYSWRSLEPQKGQYDFSAIERDLAAVEAVHKKLFVQVQDRFFEREARNLPDYLLTDPQYAGGLAQQADFGGEGKPIGSGWVAKQWNPNLRALPARGTRRPIRWSHSRRQFAGDGGRPHAVRETL